MKRRWLWGFASATLFAIVGCSVWALSSRASLLRDVSTISLTVESSNQIPINTMSKSLQTHRKKTISLTEDLTQVFEEVQNLRKEVTSSHQAMQNAEPSPQNHSDLPAVSSEPSAVGESVGNRSLSLEGVWRSKKKKNKKEDEYAARYCRHALDWVATHPDDELAVWRYAKWEHRSSNQDHAKRAFHGQKYTDVFFYSVLWRHLDRPGVYVDLAANDYKHLSNTYFADHCLHFRGLCMEANSKYWEKLDKKRHCAVVKTCIAEKPRDVTFVMDNADGGLAEGFKGDSRGKHKQATNIKMRCDTLANVFRQFNVNHVDYMNLDVEGVELQCLQGIDWKAVMIDVIAVERNPKFDLTKEFLLAHEYIETVELGHDTVFVHSKADTVVAAIAAWRKTQCAKVVEFVGYFGFHHHTTWLVQKC